MDKGNRHKIRRIIFSSWPFALALLVFLGIRIGLHNPSRVERLYSEGIYPVIARVISSFSRLIPFSLWDIFWLLSVIALIAGLILVIFRRIKLSAYGLGIARFLALGYSFFYLLWGYNYLRPGIETRAGWGPEKVDSTVFRSVLDTIISNTNSTWIKVLASDYPEIDKLVEQSYRKNSAGLAIKYPGGTRRPKNMIFSSLIAKFGLSGYFGPYFNEIHLNRFLLPMEYPFVLAHEKAHQFGITSESEANLVAFIICTTSDDKRLQYSGYLYILSYFLPDARHMKGYQAYVNKISDPVIEDFRFQRKYYLGLQNVKLRNAQAAANNVYLKTNFIKSGIKNYNQVVTLVLKWYRNNDKGKPK
jgi:hypothetical protein